MNRYINTPIIHDRHIVKDYFESLQYHGINRNQFSMPENLTIITCRNKGSMQDRIIDSLYGYEEKSILECSLEYLGISQLKILYDERLPWRNTFKIEDIYNYLVSNECSTEYIMYCDAIDVIFIDNPNRVIEIFNGYACDMLFMSTTSTDGYSCMPEVKKWADSVGNRYLNSGVWIGKLPFVISFFEEAMKYIEPHGVTMDKYHQYLLDKPKEYPVGSQDQDIFRYIQPKFHPRLKVDFLNKMAYRS